MKIQITEIRKIVIKFLKVIADQTRLEILQLLKKGERSSSEIQKILKKSQSTISQHLKTLVDSGLIEFFQKEVLIEIENNKKPNKKNKIPKIIKYYKIKNQAIFDTLSKIQSFVIDANKEKFKELRDLDVLDTLL